MEILQIAEAKSWLSQFKGGDALLAKSLLNSLTLVSVTKFETGLIKSIEKIGITAKGKIALFPIKKNKPRNYDELKTKRDQHGSEGRIAHLLTNQERKNPRKYIATPTVECMKAEKVSDIVLVDDILGSGKRVVTSWKNSINQDYQKQKTVNSWLSYKKVKLWVVSYAAYTSAMKFAVQSIAPLNKNRIIVSLKLSAKSTLWNDRFRDICVNYGTLTNKSGAALGYGFLRCTLIFQHGCPNNCPAILWANGKNWNGIFPNRSISHSFYPCFDNPSCNEGIESLFNAGQQQLALNLLDSFENKGKVKDSLNILVILGLLSKRIKDHNLSTYTSFNNDEIELIIDTCVKSGLIKKDLKLTDLGKEILQKYSSTKINHEMNETIHKKDKDSFYVPTQFFGCQRKFSGFPDE